MEIQAVIDTSAFVWDREQFQTNSAPYYKLADVLYDFMTIFEMANPKLLLRSDLLDEMINGYPFELTQGIPNFSELNTKIYSFLSRLEIGDFNDGILNQIVSAPDIVYPYYSVAVSNEVILLISEMHRSQTPTVYFTFKPIWTHTNELTTTHASASVTHDVLIYEEECNLRDFLAQYKPSFDHNPKHDWWKGWRMENGECVSPLSCYDLKDKAPVQKTLDAAMTSTVDNQLYALDPFGTFVRFLNHHRNLFHGHDVKLTDVPHDIKKHFHKR
ncbi:MAG: hypothetical protein JST49_02920 [Bacteroidetes bacterium]|nr:hypothetical protein [Bacteroidota bacterium]